MDKEQRNFLFCAAAREPGKRQIKPNAAFFAEQQQLIAFGAGDDDDEEDDDVIFPSPNSTDDEHKDGEQSSTNDNGDKEDTGGNSSDDEHSDDGGWASRDGIGTTGHNAIRPLSGGDGKHDEATTNAIRQSKVLPTNSMDHDGPCGDVAQQQRQLCAVCLNLRPAGHCGELIQCDRCAIFVHELCYGAVAAPPNSAVAVVGVEDDAATTTTTGPNSDGLVALHSNGSMVTAVNANIGAVSQQSSSSSSASTEPWFCEPCLFGVRDVPHCELCPSRYGAFKRVAGGGCWVHVQCAMFTPGVRFADAEMLSAVSWRDIDARAFGRKACAGCCSSAGGVGATVAPRHLLARTGVTVKCDAGLCRHFYHVTCAQRLGLLIDLESDATPRPHQQQHHRVQKAKLLGGCTGAGGVVVVDAGNGGGCNAPNQNANNNDIDAITDSVADGERTVDVAATSVSTSAAAPCTVPVAAAAAAPTKQHCLARHNAASSLTPHEVGYLYCEKHAPRDASVSRMRIAYAKFVESEERRMVRWHRGLTALALDARQEHKRAAQLHEYQERMRRLLLLPAAQCGNSALTAGEMTSSYAAASVPTNQRRAKMLHTNARFLDAFAEKHELLGLDAAQFAEEFSVVPAAQLPSNMTPAFSKAFVSYVEHRDQVGLPGESARLDLLTRQLAQRQQQQRAAEQGLEELRTLSANAQRVRADQQRLFDRCRAVCTKLLPPPANADGSRSEPPPASALASLLSVTMTAASSSRLIIPLAPAGATTAAASSTNIKQQSANADVSATIHNKMTTAKRKKVSADSLPAVQQQKLVVPPEPIQCQKCKKTTDAHLLAYCDTCKWHYHIHCLDPPLSKMPAKSKFSRFECSDCACPSSATDDDNDGGGGEGAEDGQKSGQQNNNTDNDDNNNDGVHNLRKANKLSSPPPSSSSSAKHWSLLQNRPKRQRRSPRASNSFVGIA